MHKLQQKLLEVAEQNHNKSMSLRQLAREIGETHPQTAKYHLSQLEKRGLVSYDSTTRRIARAGYREESGMVSIPVLGSANCGEPTFFAEENYEGHLVISKSLLRKHEGIYAVRAHGNSMNSCNLGGQSIEDGDYVLVDPKQTIPDQSDYVLSFIDGTANIKKFKHDPSLNAVVLISESTQQYHPIYIHQDDMMDYMIGGKVLQVIKSPT